MKKIFTVLIIVVISQIPILSTYAGSDGTLKINNKANDQNNNKGVSVEIIKLPNEVAGVNIHNKAAIRPAFNPKAN